MKSGRKNRQNKPKSRLQTMTVFNRSANFALPPRLFTRLRCEYTGYIAAGSGTLTSGNFAFSGNNLWKPFILSSNPTGITKIDNTATSGIIGSFGSVATSLQYNGQSALNTFYATYRIHNSRVKLIVNQQSAIDSLLFKIACVPNQEYQASSYPLLQAFSALQGFKQVMTSAGGGTKVLSSSANVRKVIGYTPAQYNTVLPTTWNNTTTTQTDDIIWIVEWDCLSTAVTNGEIFITVELDCDIECANPINPQG